MFLPDHLVEEWHFVKNVDLVVEEITAGSNRKVWWLCGKGHEWEAKVYSRVDGSGCPYCSGRLAVPGVSDLGTVYPELAASLHPVLNKDVDPELLSPMSSKKVWWLCTEGHSWEAALSHRSNGQGCPVCSNRVVVEGFNDLMTTNPVLASQWHPAKNVLKTTEVTFGSNRKVWWLCSEGHEWEAAISSRVKGKGCPFCSGRFTTPGVNDLSSNFRDLCSEFHPTKNVLLNTTDFSVSSGKKVWWLCASGHEWEARVADRTQKNHGCPVCVNQKIVYGVNSLKDLNPGLAEQWVSCADGRTAQQVGVHSSAKVLWVCEKQHQWEATVVNRTKGRNCPFCAAKTFVSRQENDLVTFLKSLDPAIKIITSERKILKGVEIDIYLPDHGVGIEFNGVYWHSDLFKNGVAKTRHYDKWLAAKNAGIQLVQVWEDDWNRNPDLIKKMLAHKLGMSSTSKVFARKTIVQPLITGQAQSFLTANHIQGFASGSHYLGLNDLNGGIVAVLVLKKEANNTLNIIRYATSFNVVGGFTKLLKYAEKAFTPDKFITFADHTVSDGGLYESNGFVTDKEIPPDYMYVVNKVRKHKFGYRLKRFRDDPNLQYVEGMTERELAQLNNLPRIWDAGKTRYVREVEHIS